MFDLEMIIISLQLSGSCPVHSKTVSNRKESELIPEIIMVLFIIKTLIENNSFRAIQVSKIRVNSIFD